MLPSQACGPQHRLRKARFLAPRGHQELAGPPAPPLEAIPAYAVVPAPRCRCDDAAKRSKTAVVIGRIFVVGALWGMIHPAAAEVCRFAGTTDHDGSVAVMANAKSAGGLIKLDVALRFEATWMLWLRIHYLVEEISTWRVGELQDLAVNIRYLVGSHIVRQQWDTFHRSSSGLQARRVQGKTLADFRRNHPGFVRHWDPSDFGRPWLQDYAAAASERRADLDLAASPLPPALRSPLALAFYWVRWLPSQGADVPVFLPGFKTEKLVRLPIAATMSGDVVQWQAPVHYAALSRDAISTATAWTSHDRHVLKLAAALHVPKGDAVALVHQEGCDGPAIAPTDKPAR